LTLIATDLEQGDPIAREAPRQLVDETPDHSQPIGAAVERKARLERRADGFPGRRVKFSGPDVREVGENDVERRRPGVGRQQVAHHEAQPITDPVGHRVLASQVDGILGDVQRHDVDVLGRDVPCPERYS
jgi:hypothetical protein